MLKSVLKNRCKRVLAFLMALMVLFTSVPAYAADDTNTDADENAVTAVAAPGGDVKIYFWLDEAGTPYYKVESNGKILIEDSKMGLVTSLGDLKDGFSITAAKNSSGDTTWQPIVGEQETIRDHYNETIITLSHEESGCTLGIALRAYDEGIAFQYLLPELPNGTESYTISDEYTQFVFPEGTMSSLHVGANQTVPKEYAVESFPSGNIYRPSTFEYTDGQVLTICEANVDNYGVMVMEKDSETARALNAKYVSYKGRYTETEGPENEVDADGPAVTPWRALAIGDDPTNLAENSNLIMNVLNKAVAAVENDKKITEQSEVDAWAQAILDAIDALEVKDADYSKVEAAIAKVPEDLSIYKDGTVKAVNDAVVAVVEGKKVTEQSEVDAMAKAIEDAVAALEYKNADYSKVEEAIAEAEALERDLYKDLTAVDAAVAAVVRGKDITEQAAVDAMATAIIDAIGNLIPKPENPFEDVLEEHFFYDPVLWALDMEITEGTSETTFEPFAECTRANVVTFLWRANGCPEPETVENPFVDIAEDAYYYKAILWAAEKGITDGTSKTAFSPDDTCTRAQIVTFLWREAGKPEPEADTCAFEDVSDLAYYKDAVLWAVEKGITQGKSDTAFDPDAICNRGETVTFLYRAVNGTNE